MKGYIFSNGYRPTTLHTSTKHLTTQRVSAVYATVTVKHTTGYDRLRLSSHGWSWIVFG